MIHHFSVRKRPFTRRGKMGSAAAKSGGGSVLA